MAHCEATTMRGVGQQRPSSQGPKQHNVNWLDHCTKQKSWAGGICKELAFCLQVAVGTLCISALWAVSACCKGTTWLGCITNWELNGLSLLAFKVQYARLPSSRVTVNSLSGLEGEQAAGSSCSGDVSACTSMSGPEGTASARLPAGPAGCADDPTGLRNGTAMTGTLPTCRWGVVSVGPELKTAPFKGDRQLQG